MGLHDSINGSCFLRIEPATFPSFHQFPVQERKVEALLFLKLTWLGEEPLCLEIRSPAKLTTEVVLSTSSDTASVLSGLAIDHTSRASPRWERYSDK